ncbi:hypothetical protein F5Y19DRAFT_483099 [Xylariaceae sp. FL1651]|nr:hypothetical protein F5Y19DRAFT_483099 [Xylariaceae sp. FL1651]
MAYVSQSYIIRLASLALVLIVVCEATVFKTDAILDDEPTNLDPWPTEPIYTYPATQETVITTEGAPPGDCLLSVDARYGNGGYSGLNCGRKIWTTTETRTLTVDCEGCDKISVSSAHCCCPMGGTHTTSFPTTPSYAYKFVCATTTGTATTSGATPTPTIRAQLID